MIVCRRATRLLVLALLASVAGACAHTPSRGRSLFVTGEVPDYSGAWSQLQKPDGSRRDVAARLRREAAEARSPRRQAPSLEGTDPELRAVLAALALAPTPARHFHVAEAYRRAGVFDRAHDHLRAAVRLDPRFAPGWDALARLWRDWGAPGEALPEAARAVYFAPGEPAYQNTRGTILQALGRFEEARGAYLAALAVAPRAAWALNNICALDLAAGAPAAARARCLAALAAAPDLTAARVNLAKADRALLGAGATEDPH